MYDEFFSNLGCVDNSCDEVESDNVGCVNIDMTTNLNDVNKILLDNMDLLYICMNPIYKLNIKGRYDEYLIKYDILEDKIINNDVVVEAPEDGNVNREIRFMYTNKFKEGYRPGGKCPDFGSKPMQTKKYDGKTKISFPVHVQPKYHGDRIMFSPLSSISDKITNEEHKEELNNFISYIPHNCLLDLIIYSENKTTKEIEKLIKNNSHASLTYIICDYFSFIFEDYDERYTILKKAYNNYLEDYSLSDPFGKESNLKQSSITIAISSKLNSTQEIEEYKKNIQPTFSNIIIKKLTYCSKKLEYKSGPSTRMLTY